MSLDTYRKKRVASQTPEPFQKGTASARVGGGLFVVQKHAARRTHYDFRLEWGGVLHSWAVPHGPSRESDEKRLAIEVEDHPLAYADFEGIIPQGNYGAGAVITWDRGRYAQVEPFDAGYEKGKLLFDLYGYKMRGRWQLVRTKQAKQWLLIKKKDGASSKDPLGERSVVSGLTVEERRDGSRRMAELAAEIEKARAPRLAANAKFLPMLAEAGAKPFTDPKWIFELKYDGYRLSAEREGERVALRYRKQGEVSRLFPEIARVIGALPAERFVLDGEIVCLDERGHPVFGRLQKRGQLHDAREIARAVVENPVTYCVFDLLAFAGFDLRGFPVEQRKAWLKRVVPPEGAVRYVDHFEKQGEALFAEVSRRGLEGIIAKRAASPYRAGRWPDWKKIKADPTGDFVVAGYTKGQGHRARLGALALGAYRGDELVFVGRVGSGFSDETLDAITKALAGTKRKTAPCVNVPATERKNTWVEPNLVVEVRYRELAGGRLLRHPVFLRVRDDKDARECVHPNAQPSEPPPLESVAVAPEPREVKITNANKRFYPDGRTKGDLVEYYRAIAPWLLPYLKDRPLVLTRYTDGIDGKSFFQKDAPAFTPSWIRRERIYGGEGERDIDYFICDDVESLLYVANLGTIPLHVWSSRVGSLERPDWCILDLDPKDAPFSHVLTIARYTKKLCDDLGLPSFVKTSGQKGMHVFIPVAEQLTHAQSRTFAELLARDITEALPHEATMARTLSARGKRVYVDHLQNGYGKTIVAPFSARPVAAASVSMPLEWKEVKKGLDPARFDLDAAVARMKKRKKDPFLGVMTERADLLTALERLQTRRT